jgi:hypothetical protein
LTAPQQAQARSNIGMTPTTQNFQIAGLTIPTGSWAVALTQDANFVTRHGNGLVTITMACRLNGGTMTPTLNVPLFTLPVGLRPNFVQYAPCTFYIGAAYTHHSSMIAIQPGGAMTIHMALPVATTSPSYLFANFTYLASN